MFKGLDSLEVLQLQGNQITAIDWSAFNNLKQLKILDLGTNHVTQVELLPFAVLISDLFCRWNCAASTICRSCSSTTTASIR